MRDFAHLMLHADRSATSDSACVGSHRRHVSFHNVCVSIPDMYRKCLMLHLQVYRVCSEQSIGSFVSVGKSCIGLSPEGFHGVPLPRRFVLIYSL